MLPKYSTFQLDYERGGLAAPVLKDILDSRLTSIWIKLLTSNNLWAVHERAIVTQQLQNKRSITVLEALN